MIKIRLRLKEILTEKEITQTDFAKQSGIRPQAISVYLRNLAERWDVSILERMVQTLGLTDINELFELYDDESQQQ